MAATATGGLWNHLLYAGGNGTGSTTLFESKFGVARESMQKILQIALSKGGDFSELFFEYRIANLVRMEEGIIKDSSERISLGVGIRVLNGEQTGYGYTNDLSFEKMKQSALTAAAIASSGKTMKIANLSEVTRDHKMYDLINPVHELELTSKIDAIERAHDAALKYDSRIQKVQVRLSDEIRFVTIVNSEGLLISDARPQVRLMVNATAEDKGELSTSSWANDGGRVGMNFYKDKTHPEELGKRAAEEAILLLSAVNAQAGEQPVVLGKDQSGVMIHEAVGHPLEADSNRKKESIMWDKMHQMVANPIVTIYDDPTIPFMRGTHAIDDEGTFTQKKMLIEKGKLVGFLQDRLSARLMGDEPDGHGRRENYQCIPIPRMANTVLERGDSNPDDIIGSVKKGFYAKTYQGGMVQPSGKFTFSVNMGYLIEDGKLTQPIKNATLIGTNVQILNEVEMIGNDMGFFLGTCGKDGQSAPCTAGTPTLKIRSMTVGGQA
ncbi:TldD/PmbA family protein [candidate division KSB1 bacterium]|nr:TldD/PmbA family protein [candidate division KSB1 bacterium]